uniref:Uncharacterized protein n=1 Tax=Pararge aegeria TaxID=116150 RepID=S4PWJ0_9NEOP
MLERAVLDWLHAGRKSLRTQDRCRVLAFPFVKLTKSKSSIYELIKFNSNKLFYIKHHRYFVTQSTFCYLSSVSCGIETIPL